MAANVVRMRLVVRLVLQLVVRFNGSEWRRMEARAAFGFWKRGFVVVARLIECE